MGFAQGTLLRDELLDFFPALWKHLEEGIINGFDWLPPWVRDDIAKVGLEVLLELTLDATRPYTPNYWFEEIQGLHDAINSATVSYRDILHVMLIGELTKGTCSMFGVWGNALKNVEGVDLLQLRALDWDTTGPFPKYPAIIVYHPNEGHTFANVGWVGWIGSITGMSEVQTAISEIGVYFSDASWGEESRFGYPFTYVLRDLLQFANSTDDATNILANTPRTCDILMGFGDGKANEFRGYQWSYSVLNVYDDENLKPANDSWHAKIDDIVYWAMDWDCPGYNEVMHDQLVKFYGNITAENVIRNVLPAVQTGDTHVAIYDLTNSYLYYSAVGLEHTSGRAAYDRPFTRLEMKKIFAVGRPDN